MSGVLLGHALVWTAQYIHVCDMSTISYVTKGARSMFYIRISREMFFIDSILLYLSRCFVNGLHKVKFVLSIVCQVINVAHGPLVLFCLFFMGGLLFFVCIGFFFGCVLRHSSNNIRVLFDNSSWKMKATKYFFPFNELYNLESERMLWFCRVWRYRSLEHIENCRIQFDIYRVCMPRNWFHTH